MPIAQTPVPPYYAVIFTSLRTPDDLGYAKMAEAMEKLAAEQPGFLGIESARDGLGITVSYWDSLDSIAAWKQNSRHLVAQHRGRDTWYEEFKVRVCRVERDYDFARSA
jgi:heme-degrading monooxygenase HmoA